VDQRRVISTFKLKGLDGSNKTLTKQGGGNIGGKGGQVGRLDEKKGKAKTETGSVVKKSTTVMKMG